MPKHGKEKVKKDALDLRDLYYEPHLGELSHSVDNERKVPFVLDQESEGACVGFAAAAVVNYLRTNRSDRGRKQAERVSARMLYEIGKRHDEWEGEDYEGTSLRGAMKGWFHYGVCAEALWPYDPDAPGRLSPEAALDGLKRPLGAYYRVRHRHLNHMHAAVSETGILMASSAVHDGWDAVDADGFIPYSRNVAGGHAFAIIGYDTRGFWIQNSWGPDWGLRGFGHLLYEDWLENGWDCWVARIGVPVEAFTDGAISVSSRARFDYVPRGEVDPSAIAAHLVHTGDGGVLKQSGRFGNDRQDLTELVQQKLPARTQSWAKRRIVLYAHGGLNDAKASAARIASMKDYFLANEIYPIHFMWETGILASLVGAARHALSLERATGVGERFTDLIDEAIEIGARPLGKPLWSEMKRRAEGASTAGGGAGQLVQELIALQSAGNPFELHLVCHSAGSIFHAHLIERLMAANLPIESLVLFAPSCTHALFRDKVVSNASQLGRVALFNLNDPAERDDSVGPYRKSLLYFVSEAFETQRHADILGMDKLLTGSSAVKKFLGAAADTGPTTRGYLRGMTSPAGFSSHADGHQEFDNDETTLNAMLRVILRKAPVKPF